MANMQSICSCAILLVVIAFHESPFTEGRHLKSMKKLQSIGYEKEMGKHGNNHPSASMIPSVDHFAEIKNENFPPMPAAQTLGIDDFRPTAPGNSPGVGHSFSENDIKPEEVGVGVGSGVSHSVAGKTDDFRPTDPGHSPGVGHSFKTKIAEPNA
ncbi:unnamed protein product [Ilex paraguariensis]|uniref:Precursor of CEP9 n=1 Tax=Ilex paraguariensis TaxID=185542 RepID=A0ABC8TCQ4_9AQUA